MSVISAKAPWDVLSIGMIFAVYLRMDWQGHSVRRDVLSLKSGQYAMRIENLGNNVRKKRGWIPQIRSFARDF